MSNCSCRKCMFDRVFSKQTLSLLYSTLSGVLLYTEDDEDDEFVKDLKKLDDEIGKLVSEKGLYKLLTLLANHLVEVIAEIERGEDEVINKISDRKHVDDDETGSYIT